MGVKAHPLHRSGIEAPRHPLGRPWTATLPFLLVLPPLALALGLAGVLRWLLVAALAALSVAAGLVRFGLEAARRGRLRAWADDWLLGEARRAPASDVLAAREDELTAMRFRRGLAASVRRLVRDSRRRSLPGASPANYRAAAAQAELLELLAERLAEPLRPVAPGGVVLTVRLLTDPSGPLYERERAEELGPEIARALLALEERRP
jgi:hypothetical protein